MRAGSSAAVPFLGIGVAFTALGVSGREAFLAVGIAFLALGAILLARRRKPGGVK